MKNKLKTIARIFFIIVCFIGVYTNIIDTNSDAFMGNGTALNFYTIQSNILVLVTEIILLITTFFSARLKEKVNKFLSILKYMTTVAITITLIVFWLLLAPYMEQETLLSFSCILVHFVIPLGMIADYFCGSVNYQLKKKEILYCLVPPVCYLIFCFIRANVSEVRLTGGSRFPYWFLDIDEFGWFGNEKGIGVFYWIIILAIFVLILGGSLYFIKSKINRACSLKKETV